MHNGERIGLLSLHEHFGYVHAMSQKFQLNSSGGASEKQHAQTTYTTNQGKSSRCFLFFFVIVTSPENDGCSIKFHPQISPARQRFEDYVHQILSMFKMIQEDKHAFIWMFPKIGVPPKWMAYNGKPYWNGWFGGTISFGSIHIPYRVPPYDKPLHPPPLLNVLTARAGLIRLRSPIHVEAARENFHQPWMGVR